MNIRTPVALLLLVAVGLAFAGGSWLARVELGPGRTAAAVADAGVPVLFQGPGYCLLRADDAVQARLRQVGLEAALLDVGPETKNYVYVMTEPGFDRAVLARFGTALTEDEGGVVLRTTEEGIMGLNALPVELCGIGMEPMVFNSAPAVPNPLPVSDSLIWELVGRVDAETSHQTLVRLRQFRTRYSTHDSCRRAIDWVRSKLVAYGCDSTWLETFRSNYAPNVIGMKRGRANPRQTYVVCGHVDNTSETPTTNAPGSDDNASGVVAVLEACRAFQDIEFERTVWFVGFSGEEQGLVGSDSFVRRSRDRGDSIALGINFDMISYGRQNMDTIRIVYHPSSSPGSQMADFFIAQADTFTALKSKKYADEVARSDHASFWKYGYSAIRGGYNDRTPMYHTTGDTIGPFHYTNCGTNNIPMHTEVIKALVATVAKLAGAYVPVGMEETSSLRLRAANSKPGPAIVRGMLWLRDCHPVSAEETGGCTQPALLDVTGRKVMELVPGQNDVSGLAPGVYFVREEPSAVSRQPSAASVRKVIVTR